MKPYLFIAKIRVLSAIVYRFDVISSIIVQCIVVIATSYFWIAAYGEQSNALGVSKEQMLTYTIMSAVISCLLRANVENRIIHSIRDGSVAIDLLKPVNIFGMYLAEDLGSIVISIFQNILPLVVIASILIHIPIPASGWSFLLFAISVLFSFIINWLISASFAMLAFYTISMGPLGQIKGSLIRILSGSIVPIWFFPEWLQTILRFLPFMYIYQLPLSIYIGKLAFVDILKQIGLQAMWVFILYVVFDRIQKKVLLNVLVQGG